MRQLTSAQEARLLTVLASSMFIVVTSTNMLAPLLLLLADEFHTSLGTIGQLMAASAIPWATLAPLMGSLSDRHGRRPVMALGLTLLGAATVVSAFSWDYTSLFVIRFIAGIGGATTGPNTMAAPADYFPPARRGRAVGLVLSGMSLATIVGVPAVALASAHLGWRWAFGTVGVMLLILAASIWTFLPRTKPTGTHGSYLSGFARALNSRTTVALLVSNLLERCSFVAVTTFLAAFLMQSYLVSLEQVAPVLSAIAVGTLVGSVIGGRLADRWNQRRLYVTLLAITALLAFPLFATTPGIAVTSVLAATFGLANAMARPAWLSMLTRVPEDRRGATTGFAATTNQTGIVVGAAIGGLLVGSGSYLPIGIMASGAALVSAVACTLSAPRPLSGR